MGVYIGTSELKNAYIGEVWEYTISNIPTTDTNVYVNVARSWKTIQSVKFKFTATYTSSRACYVLISSNNSNTNRYWLSFWVNTSWSFASVISIRGRLWGSDTYYRQIASSISWAYNIEYTISRDGNCVVKYNWNTTNYTATWAELTVIQTIMNLSNMNVYSADYGGRISWNKVDVTVTYS